VIISFSRRALLCGVSYFLVSQSVSWPLRCYFSGRNRWSNVWETKTGNNNDETAIERTECWLLWTTGRKSHSM